MENRAWHLLKPLDVLAMQKAACHLLGHHDFTSFRDSECQSRSPVKTLDLFQIQGFGELISAEVRSKSFLHHQVRIMMGTMVQVGLGKMHYDDMPDILNAKDRRVAGPTAPACGLYFVNVEY